MPEFEGAKFYEETIKKGFEAGKSFEDMGNELFRASEQGKEFARGTIMATNALSALVEAMYKSRGVFADFMSTLERSSIVSYAFAKSLNDVTQNLRGATSGVEGFITAVTTLSTKTFPDVVKHVTMAMSSYGEQIVMHKRTKEVVEEQIAINQKDIETKERWLNALIKAGERSEEGRKRVTDLGDELGQLKERTEDLKKESEECSKQIKMVEESVGKLGATMTKVFGWVTLGVTALVALSQAYDVSIKAKREVIYTLGRLGVSYADNIKEMDKFNVEFGKMAGRWGMLGDEMAKAIAPLSALGIGAGLGGATATGGGRETLKEIADVMGGMFRGYGIDMGISQRALGTFSTALNLTGSSLSDVFFKIAVHGERSVLGMQRYITETTTLLETTRKYGGSQESAILMLDMFGEQVKKGTIGLDSLARIASPAMWTPQQQGAMVSLLQQYAPAESRALKIEGNDMFTAMMTLQDTAQKQPGMLTQGLSKVLDKMVPPGASEGERAFLTQQLLQQLTGTTIPLMKVAEIWSKPEELAKMIAPADTKKAEENMRAKTEKSYDNLKTIAENLVPAVNDIRNLMVQTFKPVVERIGSIFGVKTFEEREKIRKQEDVILMEQRIAEFQRSKIPPEVAARHAQFTLPTGGGINVPFAGPRIAGEKPSYMSDNATSVLESAETARRRGVDGKNVSVSLGNFNINIERPEEMQRILDKTFDQIKEKVVQEVGQQYKEAQAHSN